MGVFPKYARNGFHFASERYASCRGQNRTHCLSSYGGHYAPVFNAYFLEQNSKNIPGAHKVNLKSVTINNGWYDPLIQYQAYYNYSVSPGNTYGTTLFNKSTQAEMYNMLYGPGNCVDQLKQCYRTARNDVCSTADSFCASNVESIFDVVTGRDEYDMRELTPDPFPYNGYTAYLNSAKVQKAVGMFTNYSESSAYVGNAFGTTGDDARESMTIEDIRTLLASNVTVTLWAGDADVRTLLVNRSHRLICSSVV